MKKIIVGLASMGIFGYVNAQTKDEICKNLAQQIQDSQSNLQTSLARAPRGLFRVLMVIKRLLWLQLIEWSSRREVANTVNSNVYVVLPVTKNEHQNK